MRTIANKYNLLSLKTDARNSIKDGSASVIGFFSVLVASQFGILQADAIGGIIIAGGHEWKEIWTSSKWFQKKAHNTMSEPLMMVT
jgi:hypothetical protein